MTRFRDWFCSPCLMALLLVSLVVVGPGCGSDEGDTHDRSAQVLAEIEAKWGKSYDQLPADELVVVSPHNKNIEDEFAAAFSVARALETGRRVKVTYADLGGSTQILDTLRNYYTQADTSEAGDYDIVWGGGENNFMKMADEGLLTPMTFPEGFADNVPATFGGLEMYNPDRLWAGAAVSGFGFLYNQTRLKQLGIEPPALWDDLADRRFFGQVALADPMKSGSAAAAYEMIVQSGTDWPDGWSKLLEILANAHRIYDGASGAADAVISEAPVATCIDFYGVMRVNKYPEDLVYVSPKGQTAFSPDPIAILKDPPHPQLAQEFVDFVLSPRGQALWALPVGAEDGPTEEALYRQPIRRDAYEIYGEKLLPGVSNPYQAGNEMELDTEMRSVRYGVLRHLVRAAAVDNAEGLQQAKQWLLDHDMPAGKVQRFHALPENVDSAEEIRQLANELKDDTRREQIMTGWQQFFRRKYEAVTE